MSGTRVIGFANARGKGDHSHIQGQERPCRFTGVDQRIEDFIAQVQQWRAEH